MSRKKLNEAEKILSKQHKKERMREWRLKNRNKIYQYRRLYLKKTGKRYYISKGEKIFGLAGTSGLGRKYELIALNLLKGSKDCNKYNFRGGWDIEWNGLKIDVKMRQFSSRNNWNFSTHKTCKADYFLLFCVDNGIIEKILLIPKIVFKLSLAITKKSKYDKYVVHLN